MIASSPHFLLFSQTTQKSCSDGAGSGRWHFVLEAVDGSTRVEAGDTEPDVGGERLELLAVVRGLEALDQPSRVTILTASRRVSRGLRYGLDEWSENGWKWERFGRMVPVKNWDLWQRIDRAKQFHRIECRTWRIDDAHRGISSGPFGRSARRPACEQVLHWKTSGR